MGPIHQKVIPTNDRRNDAVNCWFGARWLGFLESPKMKGIGILGCAPIRIPNHRAPSRLAPQNRPSQKETRKSSNHPFCRGERLLVSGRLTIKLKNPMVSTIPHVIPMAPKVIFSSFFGTLRSGGRLSFGFFAGWRSVGCFEHSTLD